MNKAVVGFGSNIDPEQNILRAKEALKREHTILAESEFIKTKPIGIKDQPDFINGAVLISTALGYDEFKSHLKKIESSLGREKNQPAYGPRTIDLDILVWNGKIKSQDVRDRDFVRQSVLEILPDLAF